MNSGVTWIGMKMTRHIIGVSRIPRMDKIVTDEWISKSSFLDSQELLSFCAPRELWYFMTEISIYFIKKIEEKRILIEISKS